jgi:hypothetical protein
MSATLADFRSRRHVSPRLYSSYAPLNMGWEELTWPDAAGGLVAELSAAKGRVALIVGEPDGVDDLVRGFASDTELPCVRLGIALAGLTAPPSSAELEAAVERAQLLRDIELVFWPDLGVSPLAFLRRVSRRRPLVSVWPGHIGHGRAWYSDVGRPDHFDEPLRDAVVLRPRGTSFPDELPFDVERIAP